GVKTFKMLSLDSRSIRIPELTDVLSGLNGLFPAISTLGIGRWGSNSEPVWPIDRDDSDEGNAMMVAEGFDWPDHEASLWPLAEQTCPSLGDFKDLKALICSYSYVPDMARHSGHRLACLEERRGQELAAVMTLADHCAKLSDVFIDRRGWHFWKRRHYAHWTKRSCSRSGESDQWEEVKWFSQGHLAMYIDSL
ncbi:uncharacterized protein EI90DRAFT_3056331, partial [Cantharellus anzutake]|uniref:uncharacterized protein n=1 Tax=Cantharellus anzutake TaxID=1750568 RepID=UPI001905D938